MSRLDDEKQEGKYAIPIDRSGNLRGDINRPRSTKVRLEIPERSRGRRDRIFL